MERTLFVKLTIKFRDWTPRNDEEVCNDSKHPVLHAIINEGETI